MRHGLWRFLLALTPLFGVLTADDHLAGVQAQLTLTIFDLAHLDSAVLDSAERALRSVFADIGVEVVWRRGDPDSEEAHTVDWAPAGHCPKSLTSSEIRLRIIEGGPVNVAYTTLGLALPCARSGVGITIFWDRIEAAASYGRPSPSKILAYAMAHELGHMLLRTNGHASSGIMKAQWGRFDWSAVAMGKLAFEPDQAAQILRQISYSKTTNAARPPP